MFGQLPATAKHKKMGMDMYDVKEFLEVRCVHPVTKNHWLCSQPMTIVFTRCRVGWKDLMA